MIGINQAEIAKGHVEKLKNNLPASAYKKWDAMFVSYVLNWMMRMVSLLNQPMEQ